MSFPLFQEFRTPLVDSTGHVTAPFQKRFSRVTILETAGTDYLTPDTALPAFQALSDAATISWDFANYQSRSASVTLAGNRALSITNIGNGATGTLIVKQDGTGGRTLTLPAGSKVINGGAGTVTLSASANAVDILSFIFDGTNYWWSYGTNYS